MSHASRSTTPASAAPSACVPVPSMFSRWFPGTVARLVRSPHPLAPKIAWVASAVKPPAPPTSSAFACISATRPAAAWGFRIERPLGLSGLQPISSARHCRAFLYVRNRCGDRLAGRSTAVAEGLRQLEYRGYDSAGVATVEAGQLHCIRAKGKLVNLSARVEREGAPGLVGIGHTRWATRQARGAQRPSPP